MRDGSLFWEEKGREGGAYGTSKERPNDDIGKYNVAYYTSRELTKNRRGSEMIVVYC